MTTEEGNLVFLTSSAQNIEFRTGSLGKIKLNDDDLGECLHQVMHWENTALALLINIY
jgi:cubilin